MSQMFTLEDLPTAVAHVQSKIRELGLDPSMFEIDIRESDCSIRVAVYTDNGGAMTRLFGSHHYALMEQEIRTLFKLDVD